MAPVGHNSNGYSGEWKESNQTNVHTYIPVVHDNYIWAMINLD